VTATTEARPEPAPEKAKPSTTRNLIEWVLIIAGALLVAFVVKTFLFQAFFIPTPSMVPTLEVHDRVLVNKLSYRLHDVHRGDIVVFEKPSNDPGGIRDLIKRVVAVPGDTIESRGDTLYVNGKPVSEPFRSSPSLGGAVTTTCAPASCFGPLPAGKVFVMGDNRTNSSDSRIFGAIDEDRIVGRAFVKIWPIGSWSLL
jgi:signal peptidase I